MYQGNNPSALRSREEIVKAFLLLLEQTSLEDISVKEIMEATDLSRQTFYQIFNSKEEILEYYLDTIYGEFIQSSKTQTVNSLCDAANVFFAFFETYRHSLELIIRNKKSCTLQRKCREYLQKDDYIHYALKGARTEEEQAYAVTFVISGMVAMLEQWIRTGADTDSRLAPEGLAALLCRITGF